MGAPGSSKKLATLLTNPYGVIPEGKYSSRTISTLNLVCQRLSKYEKLLFDSDIQFRQHTQSVNENLFFSH
jgi:hypothetical protein